MMYPYPQFNHISADVHVSTELASMVCGEFVFPAEMPHELRIQRIFALNELYRTVQRIGDLEHTSDWDWSVIVEDDEGVLHGDGGDEIGFPYQVEPEDYTSGFSRWEVLNVMNLNGDGDEFYSQVAIDSIRKITIEEL